jgi:hypothetical protein
MSHTVFAPIIGVSQLPGVPPIIIQHLNAVQENVEILTGQRGTGNRALMIGDLEAIPVVSSATLQQITATGSSSITTVAALLADEQRLISDVVKLANDVNALRNTLNSLIAKLKG